VTFQFQELGPGGEIPTNPEKSCGGCTACCFTVPVKEIGLTSFKRCPHLQPPFALEVGCSIYRDRPRSCRQWSCVWLSSDLPDELRPDRCGVVLDPLVDLIRVQGKEVAAAQAWVLRGYEDAWQDDPVRSAIYALVEGQNTPVLWRLPPDDNDQRLARVFMRDPNTGQVGISPPFRAQDELLGYENDGKRLVRAQQLLQAR